MKIQRWTRSVQLIQGSFLFLLVKSSKSCCAGCLSAEHHCTLACLFCCKGDSSGQNSDVVASSCLEHCATQNIQGNYTSSDIGMWPRKKVNISVLFNLLFLSTINIQITLRHGLMSTATSCFLDSKSSMESKTTFSVTGLYVGCFAVHLPCFENFHKI